MRVDYTLPALQPEALSEQPAAQGTERSFREHIRSSGFQLPVGWEQKLRLDARPFTGTYIGPPPRPHSLQLYDAETERSRWRNLLWRHSLSSETAGEKSSQAGQHSVNVMLVMLLEMQQMEDSIMSHQVALTRG